MGVLFHFLLVCLSHSASAFIPPLSQHASTRTTQTNIMLLYASKSGGRLLNTPDEYERAIASEDTPVMVWFTAPWCGPCRLSIPVVKDIIKQYSGKVQPFEICTDDLPDVVASAGVVSIPTIHLYYRGTCGSVDRRRRLILLYVGKLMDTLVGCVAKQVLAGSIDKVMDDIAIESARRRDQ